MDIYLGENDDEIGLMSLLDDLIVLHNGERYTINGYIIKLQKENKQLKERNTYLENSNNRREETIISLRHEQQLDKYKEVIEELRNYMKENRTRYIYQDGLGEDWLFKDLGVYDELLEILDKVKGEMKLWD